jgi:polyhydroxyalkanoate synthase
MPDEVRAELEEYVPADRITEYGMTFSSNAFVLGCNEDVAEACPSTPEEFFDLNRFPGDRAMIDRPFIALTYALAADGVPPEDMFPMDLDRAFNKLGEIKDAVKVWYSAGDQMEQIVRDEQVSMGLLWSGRAYNVLDQGTNLAISWDGAVHEPGQWFVVADSDNQEAAWDLITHISFRSVEILADGTLREVYHYRPAAKVQERGDPVLLVTPLAAPALCFDLRRGCSLVEHFVNEGRPTYLGEYGEVSFRDRALGMEHWIDEVVPTAIREVSEHAGGRPVHVIGWSLGGIFALLTAADSHDLPIASLTIVGSPIDISHVPLIAPVRPLLNALSGNGPITKAYQLMGGAPKPLVKWAFQLSSFQKLVTKPLVKLANCDDADFLAQVEAVDRFTANMIAYPGRTFGQLYHRFAKGNSLAAGSFELDDRTIEFADIDVPVLIFAGANDSIAPIKAVRALEPMLTGSPEVRFEVVPGGHLGMLTGRAARGTTWQVMDEWISQLSGEAEEPAETAASRSKSSTKESSTIGTNRTRRHGSAASRSLAT